jgi:hypothetical protein
MAEALFVVAAGTAGSGLDAMIPPRARIVVEDPSMLSATAAAAGSCSALSDFVSVVRDVYHPATIAQTAAVLRALPAAIGAERWSYAGVSLWNTVVTEFHWRYLDSAFQAADIARDLLDATSPGSVRISQPSSYVARALAAAASARGIPVSFAASGRRLSGRRLVNHLSPPLAHARDCGLALRARHRPRSGHAPFLLLNHAPRNFQAVAPALQQVASRLSADRILVVHTDGDDSAISRAGFAARRFVSYASWRDLAAFPTLSEMVRPLMAGDAVRGVDAAGLEWDGVPLGQLAKDEISFGLPHLLGVAIRELATARRMLLAERPAVVIMTEDRSSFSRAVAAHTRNEGIPTLLVQWGPIARCSNWLPSVAANVAAVEGDAAAEVLRASDGGASLRVVPTGQPRYEELLRQAARTSREADCRALSLDPARPIVLFGAHPVRERSASMKRNFVEEDRLGREVEAVVIAAVRLGIQLIVKPHPNEGTSRHQDVIVQHGNPDIRLIPGADSPYPFLHVCDAVITHRSTLGLEGVLLGRPLLIVNLCGTPDAFPYVDSGVALGAHSEGEVEPALRRVIFDEVTQARMAARRPQFLSRFLTSAEGSATERLGHLMMQLAEQGATRTPLALAAGR